jgi:uncharacterized protein (TIGR03067 family)
MSRIKTGAALVLFAGAVLAAAVAAERGGEQAKFAGVWQVVSGHDEGKPLAAARVKGSEVEVRGNMMAVKEAEGKRTMQFTLRPDQKPRAIDFKLLDGEDKGKTALGIYAFEGDDSLKICLAVSGEPRPKDFEPRPGSKQMMYVLKRTEKK